MGAAVAGVAEIVSATAAASVIRRMGPDGAGRENHSQPLAHGPKVSYRSSVDGLPGRSGAVAVVPRFCLASILPCYVGIRAWISSRGVRARADPTPHATAPASSHTGTSPGATPPVGTSG